MVKQTEQQKRITALMKSIRQYDNDVKKGKIKKRKPNYEEKYDHILPNGQKCNLYLYTTFRYSPRSYEEIRIIKVPVKITKKSVVLGEKGAFYIDGTAGASNTDLKRMIRDKKIPDVGVRTCILHSSCFAVKNITIKLAVNITPTDTCANSWWFWYLAELTRFEEKGRAFDLLMAHTHLCEDVIGVIGEYL